MFERITEAEINERSMANVSTTPGRKTAFGEGGLDAKALKLRFDRLGRYLAKRLNEVFDGIADGSLAEVLYIDSKGKKRSLKDFVDSLLTGQVESIKIQTSDGVITLTELGDRNQEMYNGLDTGELAGKIKIIEGVTLKKFYEDFLKFEGNTAPVRSVNGKIGEVELNAEDVGARPDNWMPTLEELDAEKAGSAATAVSGHNVQTNAHNDIRLELQRLAGIIADILDSDDATLDEMHEVVAYIKSNKALIEAITTSKVNVADIINNLDTNVSDKPLSAAQGVALKALIALKLSESDLASAINAALAQAKESGDFAGEKGDKGDGLEIVTTTGTGEAYEATVKGITELKTGVGFVMIPHVTSTSGTPTLDVNGLGPIQILRKGLHPKLFYAGYYSNWLGANRSYRVMYDGACWVVVDLPKTSANDLDGIVPVAKGGVPSTNAGNAGKVLTTNASGTPEWQEPSGGGESMLGEWVLNEDITITPKYDGINIVFMCEGVKYVKIVDEGDGVYYYDENGEPWSVYYYNGEWERPSYRNIQILEEASAEVAACIKANAKRKQPVGVEEIKTVDNYYFGTDDLTYEEGGIYWSDGFGFINGDGVTLASGNIYNKIPLTAGKNITFSYDEENNAIAINATSNSSSGDTIIDKTEYIDFWYGNKRDVSTDGSAGITWTDTSAFLDSDEDELKEFTSYHRIPVVAGKNVTFEPDYENQVVKINATGDGSQGFHTNLYPMFCQALAIPKAIPEANGEMFYSIDAYEAGGNMVLGDDLYFEEFVDLAMFGSSGQFSLEIANNSDFWLKLCVKVTWEELLAQITDREKTVTIYVPPNDFADLTVSSVEQNAADEQSWGYEILGARFTLNNYD